MEIIVIKNGQQYGPYTIEQLRGYVQQGNFTTADQACCDGRNWVTIGQVPGFVVEGPIIVTNRMQNSLGLLRLPKFWVIAATVLGVLASLATLLQFCSPSEENGKSWADSSTEKKIVGKWKYNYTKPTVDEQRSPMEMEVYVESDFLGNGKAEKRGKIDYFVNDRGRRVRRASYNFLAVSEWKVLDGDFYETPTNVTIVPLEAIDMKWARKWAKDLNEMYLTTAGGQGVILELSATKFSYKERSSGTRTDCFRIK